MKEWNDPFPREWPFPKIDGKAFHHKMDGFHGMGGMIKFLPFTFFL